MMITIFYFHAKGVASTWLVGMIYASAIHRCLCLRHMLVSMLFWFPPTMNG